MPGNARSPSNRQIQIPPGLKPAFIVPAILARQKSRPSKTGNFLRLREASGLRFLPGLGPWDGLFAGRNGSGTGRAGPGVAALARTGVKLLAQATFRVGGADGEPDPEEGEISDTENGLAPQPSDPDGVPEDMATMVLDKSALGTSQSPWLGANPPAGFRGEVGP